jgi:hypothetical protein
MASLCALSFACALIYARANPAAGYFMTLTRLHELGLGGLVGVWGAGRALAIPADGLSLGTDSRSHRAPGRARRTLAATAGVLAIGGSGFIYSPRLPFPGAAALVPALGAAAVIVAGEGVTSTHALAGALAHPWLQYVGDISYSLYLAHWPVVVMYPYMTGRPVDGFAADGVMAAMISFALAHGCKLLWENRFRGHVQGKRERGMHSGLAPTYGAVCAQAAPPICHIGSIRTFTSLRLASSLRQSPLVGALLMTALMTTATLVTSSMLYHESEPQTTAVPATESEGITSIGAAPFLLNSSAAAATQANVKGCADFFGINASHPYPGAEVAVRGCQALNDLPISAALASMNDARHGRVHGKPYPNAIEAFSRRSATPQRHIYLMGDSHAYDWVAPLKVVGSKLGLNVTVRAKPSCPPTLTALGKGPGPHACQQWVAESIDMAVRERPLAVVFIAYTNYDWAKTSDAMNSSDDTALAAGAVPAAGLPRRGSAVADGVVLAAERVVAAGIPVLYVKSTPVMQVSVPDCLAKEAARTPGSANLTACSTDKRNGLGKGGPVDMAAVMYPMMRRLSFDDVFCPNDTCPPVIGNVVVYRDRHHLTKGFALSLVRSLEQKLVEAAPHLKQT